MKKRRMTNKFKAGMIVALAVVCIGCASKDQADEKKNEELNKLIEWNLEEEYPAQAVEVAQLYCSLTKEIHAKDFSEEQIEQLLKQLRQLFDDELLKGNPYEDHLNKITKEIKQYRKDKITINRYTVEDSDKIELYTDDNGNECGIIEISYSIKKGSQWLKSNEQLIIRKDSKGSWKILGNRTAS